MGKERIEKPDNQSQDLTDQSGDGFSVLMEYLQSDKGHELASRVVGLIEEVKKSTLDKNVEQSKLNIDMEHKYRTRLVWLQGIVFVSAIIAASTLTILGKFDSTIGFFFGTLVGYFFGRKPSQDK